MKLFSCMLLVAGLALPGAAGAQVLGAAGQDALETARSGTGVQWVNPDTGAVETITPKPAFRAPSGEVCREFQQEVRIGGQVQQAWGIACRQPDGSWRLQRANPREVAVSRPTYVAPPPVVYVPPPPPTVVYAYPPPVYFPRPVYYPAPAYYYPRPVYYPRPYYSSSVGIWIGSGRSHYHGRYR